MATTDDNQACEEDDAVYPFKNNFIDTPWDDRSKNSKIGIISLLVGISAVIAICVCNSCMMHYATGTISTFKAGNNCHVMNWKEMEGYKFVAKVYSMSSRQLLCLGAILSATAVLVDDECARVGPVRLLIGASNDPRCKKHYNIDADDIIEIDHGGIMSSRKLIILQSHRNLAKCGSAIRIGSKIEWNLPAYVIGPPLSQGGRALKMQPVFAFGQGNCTLPAAVSMRLDRNMIICVKDFGSCPVHGGELLVQQGHLVGLASFCIHRSSRKEAYFADLTIESIATKITSIAEHSLSLKHDGTNQ